MKSNKILLLESANLTSWLRAEKYESVYVYSGDFFRAKRLSCDFLDAADYHMSNYKAAKVIDGVYAQYIKESEARVLNEIMDDERGHFVIKKTILYELGELFFSFILAEKFIKQYGIEETIDFIPCAFSYTLYQLISKRKDLIPQNINIPKWYIKKMNLREIIKNSLYRVALILYPLGLSLFMSIDRFVNKCKKKYRYGIYIWNNWVNSVPSPYRMDFLEDKDGVDQTNTLYIMDKKMSKANLQKIKTSGYYCCYFEEMVRQFSVWKYLKTVYPDIRRIAKKIISTKSNRILLTESYLKTLRWYILWEIFYFQYNIETFLAVQEPGNIPRVLCQKRHGSRNMFIYISTSPDHIYRENMNTYIETYYGLMIYDVVISSRMSCDYFKKNNNFIARFIDCGILPSDIIFQVKHDSGLKTKIKKELGISKHKTVIGFFDTSIGGMGGFNNHEGCRVVNDVYRLLESNEDYCVIYGSRNAGRFLENSDIKKADDRLIAHERVFYLNKLIAYYKAYDFMGVCDLVIGCFFSSAPQESVAGGVRTICYAPSERFNKDVFIANTFPRFCAFGYKQLKEYTDYWLHQCSEEDFRNFQDTYIKKYVDGYCDGQATERLHSLLKHYDKPMHEPSDKEKIPEIIVLTEWA